MLRAITTDGHDLRQRLRSVEAERDAALETLAAIHDFAHERSTGPAVPDALWEIRSMAAISFGPTLLRLAEAGRD